MPEKRKTDVMHATVLNDWFAMAKDDAVEIDPADINHEAMSNMWCFSPTDEETPQIHAAAVDAFIRQLIAARGSAVTGKDMLFYCWHDAQCRQLRFSLVSRAHGRLPFRREIRATQDLSLIVARVVDGDWRNEHVMQAAQDDDDAPETASSELEPFILPVFVVPLP